MLGAEKKSQLNLAEKIAYKMNYQGEIIWDESFPNGTPRNT